MEITVKQNFCNLNFVKLKKCATLLMGTGSDCNFLLTWLKGDFLNVRNFGSIN